MSKRGENIYKRKDGRWEGRISVEAGRYRYFYEKSYAGVKKKMKEWLKADCKPELRTDSDSFVAEALDEWLQSCYGSIKNSTYENYYYCINKHIKPFFRNNRIGMIDENRIQEFVKHICANSKISQAYQKKILQVFKTSLKGILNKNEKASALLGELTMPKRLTIERPVEVFSTHEQSQIEANLLISRNKKDICLLLCFYTGIRLGEVCALKWSRIDIDSKTIIIDQTLTRTKNFSEDGNKTKLTLASPKSRSSIRKIPIPDFLCELLCEIIPKIDGKEHFVLSDSSKPLDPRTFQRYYKRVLDNTHISSRKFHTIRHTFATRALEVGIDIRTLSDLLGHSGVTSTINTYSHSLLEQKKLAISKMNMLHTNNLSKPQSSYLFKSTNAVNKAVGI